ncbi:MAG TPA: hypothetical protein VF088_11535 [Pyrinomonadaceae bacterium]
MSTYRLGLWAIFICAVVTIGCALHGQDVQQLNANFKNQTPPALSLEIPDARWEPLFFEALEKHTKKAGIASLRSMVLPDQDLEVRFWYDHFEVIQGVIIRRSGEKWSASYLRQKSDHEVSLEQENLEAPKSGWNDAWNKLTSAGILVLPDGSAANCKSEVLDGIGYVVETNLNRKYRTYRYGNPQFSGCDEARRILAIESILAEEFSLPRQK